MTLSNSALSELLVRDSEEFEGDRKRALRRAARAALMWPDEIADLLEQGRPLTDLNTVGPWIARRIEAWMEAPPEVGEPPPARTGFISYAEARAILAGHPDWNDDLRGDLQIHTTYSDGAFTVAQVAEAAALLEYDYAAITDHSKGLKIAGGMDEATLERQRAEIEGVNEESSSRGGARLLRAIEMNIDIHGRGDMEPDSLDDLELVLGAFHSQLRRAEDQTDRYITGLRNRHVHILAHPRCRMWDTRIGLQADWPRVFGVAAELDKAVEIDAHPNRQDLDIDLARLAAAAGTKISIGTDSHYPDELIYIDIGLAAAISAGVPRDSILNFKSTTEITEWAAALRS